MSFICLSLNESISKRVEIDTLISPSKLTSSGVKFLWVFVNIVFYYIIATANEYERKDRAKFCIGNFFQIFLIFAY